MCIICIKIYALKYVKKQTVIKDGYALKYVKKPTADKQIYKSIFKQKMLYRNFDTIKISL